MLLGGAQILTDGDEIDVRLAHVIHDPNDLVSLLSESEHDAGFRKRLRLDLLHAPEQFEGSAVVGPPTPGSEFATYIRERVDQVTTGRPCAIDGRLIRLLVTTVPRGHGLVWCYKSVSAIRAPMHPALRRCSSTHASGAGAP